MSIFISLLGLKGLIFVVGALVFSLSYKYSLNIFDWIEHQTYGTRTYIMERLEFLFIEIPQQKVTYILLGSSVGIGAFIFLLFGVLGKWVLGILLGGIALYNSCIQ